MIPTALLLLLTSNNLAAKNYEKAAPQTHYRCEVQRRTDVGTFHVTRTLDSAGRLLKTSALWHPRENSVPEVGAGWIIQSGQKLDLTRGYIVLEIGKAAGLDNVLKGHSLSNSAQWRARQAWA